MCVLLSFSRFPVIRYLCPSYVASMRSAGLRPTMNAGMCDVARGTAREMLILINTYYLNISPSS